MEVQFRIRELRYMFEKKGDREKHNVLTSDMVTKQHNLLLRRRKCT